MQPQKLEILNFFFILGKLIELLNAFLSLFDFFLELYQVLLEC